MSKTKKKSATQTSRTESSQSSRTGSGSDRTGSGSDRKATRRATSDVGALRSFALAAPFYGLMILGARSAPPNARELLLERGWPPHATMILTALAMAILLTKAFGLGRQRRAFALDLLPDDAPRIVPDDAATIVERLDAIRRRGARSFLVERVRRVLSQYAAHGDVGEASAANDADADADAASVAASFATVKVLVWAMPILGLIGTVIGLSGAVGAFSHAMSGAEQLDAIKDSLREVTTGLAVAFDATFVALVASIVVMLPLTWLQKAEDQLINDVDDYCVTHVLTRLGARERVAPEAPAEVKEKPASFDPAEIRSALVETLAQPIAEMIAAHGRALDRLAEDRRAAADAEGALGTQIAAFSAALAQAAPAMDRAAGQLEKTVAAVGPSVERLASEVDRARAAVGPSLERAVTQLDQSAKVAAEAAAAAERAQDQLSRELGASRQLLSLLAAGLGDASAARPRHANGAHGVNGTLSAQGA